MSKQEQKQKTTTEKKEEQKEVSVNPKTVENGKKNRRGCGQANRQN